MDWFYNSAAVFIPGFLGPVIWRDAVETGWSNSADAHVRLTILVLMMGMCSTPVATIGGNGW
jgi:hypothetical protein